MITKLAKFFKNKNICSSHGYDHALIVGEHALNILTEFQPSSGKLLPVLYASLLHDVDDRKFYNSVDYENARELLDGEENIELIINMIKLVSSSKNGNNIPEGTPSWMLIPRWADRLESIGKIGIERCWQYTKTVERPLFTPETLRATTEEEIWSKCATKERMKNYKGNSASMIDHYYDKLLHFESFEVDSLYVRTVAEERKKIMVELVLYYGKNGFITDEDVEKFIN